MISEAERERYNRQMIFPGWGERTQEILQQSTVFIAGAGGLGSPVAIYLAVAGVGSLRICDDGIPELSNLNRQILHDDSRIGLLKSVSAEKTLSTLNRYVAVHASTERITDESAAECIGDADVILDCLDNFETRHVLNRFAVTKGIPLIHAGVYGMSGQITTIHVPRTPCLWCIQPGSLPREVFPIVGATAGVIGSLQALEAIKYLTGIGENLFNRLLIWDGRTMTFQELSQKKNPECPVCSSGR